MIEQIELPSKSGTKNLFNVPVKQWRKWSAPGRKMFNELYSIMADSPWAFTHPKVDKIPARRWKTTCWNAAWIAADVASGK